MIKKIQNYFKGISQHIIFAFVLMVAAIIYVCIWNINSSGYLYEQSPDANLYLSIAQNFVSTGHFIQVSRPAEVDMVVPFGLPLILTIMWGLTRNIYAVVSINYIIYGITAALFYLIGYKISNNHIIGAIGWYMYLSSSSVLIYANPRFLLTEPWTVFLVTLCIYCYIGKKHWAGLVASFALFVIRPVNWPFLALFMIICLRALKVKTKQEGLKVSLKHKYAITAYIMIGMLIVNIGVNYREIGHFVFLEDYAGIAMYQANNPSTEITEYDSSRGEEFVDSSDEFWDVYNSDMTTYEKNVIWKKMASEWIKNNIGEFVVNTMCKFNEMFIKAFTGYIWFWICLGGLILAAVKRNRTVCLLFALFLLIAIMTSVGLHIKRYNVYIISGFISMLMYTLKELELVLNENWIFKNNEH